RLDVVGELRVENGGAVGCDGRRGVPALAGNHVEVVGDLLRGADGRKTRSAPAACLTAALSAFAASGGRLLRAKRHDQRRDADECDEYQCAFHGEPPDESKPGEFYVRVRRRAS